VDGGIINGVPFRVAALTPKCSSITAQILDTLNGREAPACKTTDARNNYFSS